MAQRTSHARTSCRHDRIAFRTSSSSVTSSPGILNNPFISSDAPSPVRPDSNGGDTSAQSTVVHTAATALYSTGIAAAATSGRWTQTRCVDRHEQDTTQHPADLFCSAESTCHTTVLHHCRASTRSGGGTRWRSCFDGDCMAKRIDRHSDDAGDTSIDDVSPAVEGSQLDDTTSVERRSHHEQRSQAAHCYPEST